MSVFIVPATSIGWDAVDPDRFPLILPRGVYSAQLEEHLRAAAEVTAQPVQAHIFCEEIVFRCEEFDKWIDLGSSVKFGDKGLFKLSREDLIKTSHEEFIKAASKIIFENNFESRGKSSIHLDPGEASESAISSFLEATAYLGDHNAAFKHAVAAPPGKDYATFQAKVSPPGKDYLGGFHSTQSGLKQAAWPDFSGKTDIGHLPTALAY